MSDFYDEAKKRPLRFSYPKRFTPMVTNHDTRVFAFIATPGWRFAYPGGDPESGPARWQYSKLQHALDICNSSNRERLCNALDCADRARIRLEEEFETKVIGDFDFMLLPHGDEPGRKHRLHVRCPSCSEYIPVGRLGQHISGRHARMKVTTVQCKTTLDREARAYSFGLALYDQHAKRLNRPLSDDESWDLLQDCEKTARKRYSLSTE